MYGAGRRIQCRATRFAAATSQCSHQRHLVHPAIEQQRPRCHHLGHQHRCRCRRLRRRTKPFAVFRLDRAWFLLQSYCCSTFLNPTGVAPTSADGRLRRRWQSDVVVIAHPRASVHPEIRAVASRPSCSWHGAPAPISRCPAGEDTRAKGTLTVLIGFASRSASLATADDSLLAVPSLTRMPCFRQPGTCSRPASVLRPVLFPHAFDCVGGSASPGTDKVSTPVLSAAPVPSRGPGGFAVLHSLSVVHVVFSIFRQPSPSWRPGIWAAP